MCCWLLFFFKVLHHLLYFNYSVMRLFYSFNRYFHCGMCFLAYTGKPPSQNMNGEVHDQKDTDKGGHKSLQEYVEQVQKAQKDGPVRLEVWLKSFNLKYFEL